MFGRSRFGRTKFNLIMNVGGSMLTKPILSSFRTMDATINNDISFIVLGGNQYSKFEYEIYNNDTSALIKTAIVASTIPSFLIPPNTLVNGGEYRIRVRTIDASNNYSEYSDYMIVDCYSSAIVQITNIIIENGVNKIKNQKYSFDGSYTQFQGVLLKSYQYILYKADKTIASIYPVVYQQTGILSQIINGMDNNTNYYIELKCTDQFDVVTSSGLIQFYVEYVPPRIRQVLKLTNDCENASVLIESDVRQLIFKVVGAYNYEGDEYINLTTNGTYAYLDDAFTIDLDFTLQAWVKGLQVEEDLIVLKNIASNDTLTLKYEADNRFHVYRKVFDITSHYASNVIAINQTTEYTIWIQQVNRRIDVVAQVH